VIQGGEQRAQRAFRVWIFAPHNKLVKPMFITIAIAWIYVALMLSLGSESLIAGVLGFIAWGPLPLSMIWYIFVRRRPGAAAQEASQQQDTQSPP
jgi:hypothetical protein